MAVALAEWAEEREAAVTRMLARGVGAWVALALLELAGRFGRCTAGGWRRGCASITETSPTKLPASARP